MSWCPYITLHTVGSCWKHRRALRISFSSSWMVKVGSDSLDTHYIVKLTDYLLHNTFLSYFVFNSLHGIMVRSCARVLRSTQTTKYPFCAV